jgi:pyruvate kinase
VRLHVIEAQPQRAVAMVDIAGTVSNRKGVSLPDTEIAVSSMTEKDRADLDAGLNEGVDWVAVSFVQRADDVAEVKKIVRGRAFVMSKIEKPQAISRLEEIIEMSDGLMVARGDLGVEMPLEKVPGLQKRMTRICRRQGKPVVIATQMLESMMTLPVPTRAEVSDVATAVFEGADTVMLSAESASGRYPVEAVTMMSKIAEEVEQDSFFRQIINAQRAVPEATGADAIAAAVRDVAETLDLKAIIAWTSSGATALRIARERPESPVLALTPNHETACRLAAVWGVHALVTQDAQDIDDMVQRACALAKSEGFAAAGERVIIVAGVPFGTPGATNMVRIAYIDA